MTREEIIKKTTEIVRTCLPGFENAELKEDTRINNDAGVDSMTFVYVMCKLESEFNIKIPHRKWEKMLTFGDVINAIEKEVK